MVPFLFILGLTASQLERLASLEEVQKISQRDLAYCVSEVMDNDVCAYVCTYVCMYVCMYVCVCIQGYSGGTTVSGTMVCACKAGIHVFVTGGIGGVHRGGENSKSPPHPYPYSSSLTHSPTPSPSLPPSLSPPCHFISLCPSPQL